MGQEKLDIGQESLIGWDRRRWLDGTGEVVHGSGDFDRMGQEKMIWWDRRSWYYIKTRRFFWQQMSHFDLCEDDCYQNCKVIVTKNLRWYYHLTMDEKWPNYRGMAARYWMSHQYHLAFYFWWIRLVKFQKKKGQNQYYLITINKHYEWVLLIGIYFDEFYYWSCFH